MATILVGMKACMEASEMERRLAEIEAAISQKANEPPFKPKVAA
jgi:hypothetical protein